MLDYVIKREAEDDIDLKDLPILKETSKSHLNNLLKLKKLYTNQQHDQDHPPQNEEKESEIVIEIDRFHKSALKQKVERMFIKQMEH